MVTLRPAVNVGLYDITFAIYMSTGERPTSQKRALDLAVRQLLAFGELYILDDIDIEHWEQCDALARSLFPELKNEPSTLPEE